MLSLKPVSLSVVTQFFVSGFDKRKDLEITIKPSGPNRIAEGRRHVCHLLVVFARFLNLNPRSEASHGGNSVHKLLMAFNYLGLVSTYISQASSSLNN